MSGQSLSNWPTILAGFAAKGIPVLAAGDGVVTWISDAPSNCCYVGIDHGDGWMTRYIHLNDDALFARR